MKKSVILIFLVLFCGGWTHGVSTWNGGLMQGQSNILQTGYDDALINAFKGNQGWGYIDNSSNATPADLDLNGYPLYGSAGFSHQGYYTVFFTPSQAERPGHKVVLWGGAGKVETYELSTGGGTFANVSCQYSSNGGALQNGTYTTNICDTTACTGTCTGRWEFSESSENTSAFVEWNFRILAVNSGNTVQNLAFIHISDEASFAWTMANWPGPNAVSHAYNANNNGEIFGTLYKARIAQGRFGVWRYMKWSQADGGGVTCSTWATRLPTSYFTYYGAEMRDSLYVGQPSYALNGSSNDYAVASVPAGYSWPGYTPGGVPQRNQVIIASWANTPGGTHPGTITFNLGGYGALPILNPNGVAITDAQTNYMPTNNYIGALVFDPDLNSGSGAWMSYSGPTFSALNGLKCGVPPEIDLQLSIETRTHPWFDEYMLSSVPITDYMPSLAAYLKANAPGWMIPRFTAGNEPFNNQQYGTTKANIYWSTSNDFLDWFGMAASLLCQSIFNVYGDTSKYECMVEPQTTTGGPSSGYPLVTAAEYVANGPAQAGYAQDPAYKWLTAIAINNYWEPVENGSQQEVADGWCYVNQGSGCSATATILTNYVATALNAGGFGITQYNILFGDYATWLKGGSHQCGGNAVNCNITNMYFYEGGYSLNFATADITSHVSSATNATDAVLTTSAANGCFVGMTVALSSVVGGTWSASYSGLTVTATGINTCTVNLDSTSLGALSSATLTYTGSETYINTMLAATYATAEVGTLTTTQLSNAIAAGGKWPSMFYLAGAAYTSSYEWAVWSPDIYGATSSSSDPGTPQWQAIQAGP